MAQYVLTIEFSDDILKRSGLTREDFANEVRFLLAAKLYEIGRLSSGEAASMIGLGRVDFLLSLNKFGVPMSNLKPQDLKSEVRTL